ncbi:MAG: hypothetical protein DRJ05_20750, partial [Bacteroidetes bacterium]
NSSRDNFKVFPNPAKNILNIIQNRNTNWPQLSISITDLSGRVVVNEQLNSVASKQYQVNIADLQNGIYFIHLKSNDQSSVLRFIKSN